MDPSSDGRGGTCPVPDTLQENFSNEGPESTWVVRTCVSSSCGPSLVLRERVKLLPLPLLHSIWCPVTGADVRLSSLFVVRPETKLESIVTTADGVSQRPNPTSSVCQDTHPRYKDSRQTPTPTATRSPTYVLEVGSSRDSVSLPGSVRYSVPGVFLGLRSLAPHITGRDHGAWFPVSLEPLCLVSVPVPTPRPLLDLPSSTFQGPSRELLSREGHFCLVRVSSDVWGV